MKKLLIDISGWTKEGGSCQVYPIKNKQNYIFKEFSSKKKAQDSLKNQTLLAKFDLAPKLYSKLCCLDFSGSAKYTSKWGYVTELAKTYSANADINNADMDNLQNLVDKIYAKTGLKFWDCHWYNIGLVHRYNRIKLVCIDTGKESFDGLSNAWGNPDPGPRCSYCDNYNCNCE